MLLKKKLNVRLILLTILAMTNLKSFSQNDTINSTIQLTKPVAKLVIKDLINADGLSLELKTTQDLLNSTNLKLKTQTDLVGNLQTQIYNFENIVISKDEQLLTSEKLSKDLEEALKRQKLQTTIFKIGTGVGAVATLLLLIQ